MAGVISFLMSDGCEYLFKYMRSAHVSTVKLSSPVTLSGPKNHIYRLLTISYPLEFWHGISRHVPDICGQVVSRSDLNSNSYDICK